MIETKLLDLINSGNAWVFVGSGLSIEAGLPSWPDLANLTMERLAPDKRKAVKADNRFRKAQEHGQFSRCFQRMHEIAGRPAVVNTVKQIINDMTEGPGDLTNLLADWPAAGYITTNYDHLIESALAITGLPGWITVGNQSDEIRKVSGDVRDIVWHIHGSAELPDSASRLVIASEDYDDLYLADSELQQQLKAFLTQRRLVFVGFGLRDPEIMRLLKLAGRFTVPERPIYAFLGSRNLEEDEESFDELRDHYNIEVQAYRIIEDRHRDLRDLLEVYNSMIVRRSVKYNQRSTAVPSYDPDATGLLIYNTLVLQGSATIEDETMRRLLSARVLSLTQHRKAVTLEQLCSEVERIPSLRTEDVGLSNELQSVLDELEQKGLVEVVREEQHILIRLTSEGHSLVSQRAGAADRIREQFRASLSARASETIRERQYAEEVTIAAAAFFEDCIEKRSLGVAMALNASNAMGQEFQMVALLQALPKFFGRLSNPDSAKALVKVVQGVLSAPTEAEAKHCGLLLQARLGVHLLGVDQSALSSRIRALRDTVFVLDSTSLIPLIAVSGTGHHAAVELMRRLAHVGAKAITTSNLIVEVSEHAAYASRTVREAGGAISAGVLNNLLGREGQRINVFLSGFAEECAAGGISSNDFGLYMRQQCGFNTDSATTEECSRLIQDSGVYEIDLPNTEGFAERDHVEIEELKAQIEERRRQANNYRHDRQVLAEAEVVVLVQKLRGKRFKIEHRTSDGAFFVSNSRFIDQLSSVGLPVTIRQNVLLQWLGTVAPFEESELHVLMDGLLWELSERGYDFVNRNRLRTTFSNTVSASKEEYTSIIEQHKTLIASEWGVDPGDAFQEPLDELEVASLASRHALQTIDRQKREIERVKASIARSQSARELSEAERAQFERLKSDKANRVKRNRRRGRTKGTNTRRKRKGKGRRR